MALVEITSESVSALIGESIPELYLVIAKNSVMEMDEESLAGLLGCSLDEIQEIQSDPIYKQVRLICASEHAKGVAQRDASWDNLEEMALENLTKRIRHEKDPKFNLQVAAVANRAQRRIRETRDRVLDPAKAELKIPLRLSQRIVKRINADGGREIEETREISVVDGTAVNPSFAEVDEILGFRAQRPV